jgi:GTP-binding protein EngB required for normal cell division/uncharacterized protein (DUF697 family)
MGKTKRKLSRETLKPVVPKEFIDYLKKVRIADEAFETATVQCGIIGVTGTGKSSLINALAGELIAEVGVSETTGVSAGISAYEFQKIVLIDLPGVGTANWQTRSYFRKLLKQSPLPGGYSLKAKDFDCFILVIANRILEEDLKLYHLIVNDLQKNCFLVRSKFDIDVANNFRTSRKSKDETYDEIVQDLWRNFPRESKTKVFVISTAKPDLGDLTALEAAISDCLPDVKSEKFTAYAAAHSNQFLKKKRKVAEKHSLRLAMLSAANAINPIPGLDLAVDIGILMKLSSDLREIYGLSEEKIDFEADSSQRTGTWAAALRKRAAQTCSLFLTKEGITRFLKQQSPMLTGRIAKGLERKLGFSWIPVAGRVIAAVIGFRLTSMLAMELINKFEKQASDLNREIRLESQRSFVRSS